MQPVPVAVLHPEELVLIRRVKDEWGALGNMSAHPIMWGGLEWPRAENLFQAWRFPEDSPVRELIRARKNPMSSKIEAKIHRAQMIHAPRSPGDVDRMRELLQLKLAQHEEIRLILRATGDRTIVEDCSRRAGESGLFWGAALLHDGVSWKGHSYLGRLWMEIRKELV